LNSDLNNLCPLCGQPDSGSHNLGGCAHPEMREMVIYRHDEAHRIIINAINKGRKGSFLSNNIADVGTAATLGNLGVHHKRIPKWVLPNNMLALHTTDPEGLRTKLRPDIMMVELQEHEQSIYQRAAGSTPHNLLPSSVIDPRLGRGRQRKIWIVEGGYCADTRYAEKVAEKNEQHEKLVGMLKMYGYDVQLRLMPLGYAGTIYNCNLSMLQDLGLQRTACARNLVPTQHHQGEEIPREQKMQEHDSNMPKISEPGLDESKLPYKAQSRPRRIACGKRLFRMERHSDLHPRTGRKTEVGTAAVVGQQPQTTKLSTLRMHKCKKDGAQSRWLIMYQAPKCSPWDQKQCLRSQQSKCRLARGPRRQMRRKRYK